MQVREGYLILRKIRTGRGCNNFIGKVRSGRERKGVLINLRPHSALMERGANGSNEALHLEHMQAALQTMDTLMVHTCLIVVDQKDRNAKRCLRLALEG